MSLQLDVEYNYKTAKLSVLFTKKVWYNAIKRSVIKAVFGAVSLRKIKPTEVIARNKRILVDSYVVLRIHLDNYSFEDQFYVSDELVEIVDNNADVIVGSHSIEKHHIRVLE